MAGFGSALQAAAPVLLGIGSQASGRDPAGIARGVALLQAQQERDKRKAAIDNLLSGMGIAGPEKAFLESMPLDMQQAEILRRMQPQEPVRGVPMGDRLVNPYTGDTIANYGPQPLPPEMFGDGFNIGGNVRMEGVSDPAMHAWNTFASGWVGPELNVTSAYRDPDYNARVGGAKNSQHTHGNAFDFSTSGWTQEQKQAAVQGALDAGFTGVGVYGDSLHFDTGPRRVWGPSYGKESAPEWATSMVMGGGGAQPPKPTGVDAQIGAFDTSINKLTAVLASGAGTPAQREQLEYKRKELEARRDALIQQQQAAAKAAAGPGFDTDLANTYRDDMRAEPALALFADVQSGFDAIEQFYQAPGAVSDYALAVAFAKIVDPGSVAREGEVAAVSSAAGAYPAFEQALRNAITREGKMPPEMRKEIADLGAKLYAKKADRAETVLESYHRRADRAKIPFDELWSNGPIRTLPDDWVSSVEVQPNAVERFAPPAPEQAPQPAPAPTAPAPSVNDVQAAIDSLSPAQKKTFGRLRTPSAKLDYLEKLGKL